jgi:hypothetical protein
LNDTTRKNEKLSKLNTILKHISEKRVRIIEVAAFVDKSKEKKNFKKNSKKEGDKCYRCEASDHQSTDCYHKDKKCNKCEKTDHLTKVCKSKKGKKNEDFLKQITLMMKRLIEDSVINLADQNSRKILDSRVINHIFENRSLFITLHRLNIIFEIEIENKFSAEKIESVRINLIDEKEITSEVILIKVLYFFNIHYNLISTFRLTETEVEVILRRSDQSFKIHLNDEVIELADIIDNQYVIREESTTKTRIFVITIDTWHARLKHLNYENLQKLRNLIIEMNFSDSKSKKICELCMKGRQKRKINKTPRTRATKFLKIIHIDLKEFLSLIYDDHKYYMTMKND